MYLCQVLCTWSVGFAAQISIFNTPGIIHRKKKLLKMEELKKILEQEISGIPEDELAHFVSLWKTEKALRRNETLSTTNTIDTKIYFIINGALKICAALCDKEVIYGFGFTNRFIFDFYSFFSDKSSPIQIKAIRKTNVISITKKDFLRSVKANIHLSEFWQQKQAQIILYFIERETLSSQSSAKDKYELFKNGNSEFLQQIPRKDIATYLRISPETLSRIK